MELQVTIGFPYPDVKPLLLDGSHDVRVFELPEYSAGVVGSAAVAKALREPIGTPRLAELARGKRSALVVVDDVSRPTPAHTFVSLVLEELKEGGIAEEGIAFIAALGTHRAMTTEEMVAKLGSQIVERHRVHDHDWADPSCLEYLGDTDQGAPVWINKIVRQNDLVVGIGAIIPIDICGFTGGGKILVPGLSGEATVNHMHWTRVDLHSDQVIGKADNPIRASIDALARKAGLDFIVNVITDGQGQIVHAVAGDMVAAHRAGCRVAAEVYGVRFSQEYDVVIADSYPFDIEFWQANKALDTAGEFVRKGGAIVLVSPCTEGWSQTHAAEILEFGYPPIARVKQLVGEGRIRNSVVGVHMYQVARAGVEKGRLILVSSGVSRAEVERVGFLWAEDSQSAFETALQVVGTDSPRIAVLRDAARMLPLRVPEDRGK
jgi:nickel-dependent lactate racemase